MPLIPGDSEKILHQNIAELIRSGKEPKVAAAIAYKEAGRAKKKGGKKKGGKK